MGIKCSSGNVRILEGGNAWREIEMVYGNINGTRYG